MAGLIDTLFEELLAYLEPIITAARDRDSFEDLLYRNGYNVALAGELHAAISGDGALSETVERVETTYEALKEALADDRDAEPEFLAFATATGDLILLLDSFSLPALAELPPPIASPQEVAAIGRAIAGMLTADYLRRRRPGLHAVFLAAGIVIREDVPANAPFRRRHQREVINWDAFSQLLSDPGDHFGRLYGWDQADAAFDIARAVEVIAAIATAFGIRHEVDLNLPRVHADIFPDGPRGPTPDTPSIRSFLLHTQDVSSGEFVMIGADLLALSPAPETPPDGFAILPIVSGGAERELNLTPEITFSIQGAADPLSESPVIVAPGGSRWVLSEGDAAVMGQVRLDSEDRTYLIGTASTAHISVQGAEWSFVLASEGGEPRAEVGLALGKAGGGDGLRLNIPVSDGDGFLRNIIGGDGFEVATQTEIRWTSDGGFQVSADGKFSVSLAALVKLGPVDLLNPRIVVQASGSDTGAGLQVVVETDLRATIGPVATTLMGLGFEATVGPKSDDANPDFRFGDVGLDLGFRAPNGVGLVVDGGGFKGGGSLKYESDDERYVGMLELQFKNKISLKAIGVLTTKLPGDEDGYSLLIIITSEFQPIQLGYGFTLNGVGGLLGLNRTMNVDRLRTGVRDKTLDSVLFPQDIVANANRIISDLRQVFPPREGRFIFGPMAKIGWGTPTLITIDLGLAIELPEPVTLALLGVLKAVLPDEKKKLLQLRVNFLGVIDFEKKQISFDASLFDSKLLKFTLSGDMALRLNWGADPNFLLTAGGFHPAYEPPPMALPQLRRLTLALLSGKNPRITLETYFAVTSNTVQLGAKAELYAGAGPFNIYGILAFDALFQFSPFYFIADTKAMLALRRKSKSIAIISMDLTLEGTTPWKAKGTAKLKICWFLTVKIRFNKTFGRIEDTRLDDLAILPLLDAELRKSGNWTGALPAGRQMLVSVKDTRTGEDRPVVHPFGSLSVAQKIVPLNVRIDKIGHQKPTDGNEFAIKFLSGDDQAKTSPTKELFAPAQFFDKSDEEKLTSKSFQTYDSGVELSESKKLVSDHVVRREVEYKLSYIDSQRNVRRNTKPIAPFAKAFNAWADVGAVSASPLSARSAGKTTLAPSAVKISNDDYVLVSTDDMQPVEGAPSVTGGESEIKALMKQITAENPSLLGKIQALPSYELS